MFYLYLILKPQAKWRTRGCIQINLGTSWKILNFVLQSPGEDLHDMELKKVALNDVHEALGAKMVPFAGYNMPVRYSSDMDEHNTGKQTIFMNFPFQMTDLE